MNMFYCVLFCVTQSCKRASIDRTPYKSAKGGGVCASALNHERAPMYAMFKVT